MSSFVTFLFFIIINILLIIATEPIAHLKRGQIRGKVIEQNSKRYFAFKKVPFAQPPIGALRFAEPKISQNWDGILDGTEYGPACSSNTSKTSSPQKWVDEDCLHLNIFTSEACMTSDSKCPVVYYLHGGDLEYDSAVMFNETKMVETFASKDVVLVIGAFRLGIFSHLTLSDTKLTPPNLALYDVAIGLEFVNQEISNFGGSNKNVTLFGHSYGGTMAVVMAATKHFSDTQNYYQQLVSMSSSLLTDSYENSVRKAYLFSDKMNCTPTEDTNKDQKILDCLRSKTHDEILGLQRQLEDEHIAVYSALVLAEPVFDLDKPFSDIFNQIRKIPILTGTLRGELQSPNPIPVGILIDFENQKEIDEKYRKDKSEGKLKFNYTDETCTIMFTTRLLADAASKGGAPTYMYQYLYPKHNAHTDDLSYIMGVHLFEKDENEKKLDVLYQQYFINFIKGEPPARDWNTTNRYLHSYYNINWNETSGLRPHMENHYEKELMEYWLIHMKTYDHYISQQKRQSPSFRNITIPQSEAYEYKLWLIVSIVFIIGLIVGRYCFAKNAKKDVYLTLDGYNYEWLQSDVNKSF